MIVTVTMNPAMDKTVEVDEFLPGGLNRIKKAEYDVGGKGINVSRTIHMLGGESVAVGFLGGNTGKNVEQALKEIGISTNFIQVDGETRTNTKVVPTVGAVTELNEMGPSVSQEQIRRMFELLEKYADEQTLFVLAGSVPVGVDKDIYRRIIECVHKKGAKVLLDADGELFEHAMLAGPDMVKPNLVELEQYTGMHCDSEKTLDQMAKMLLQKGVPMAVISMGKAGAVMFGEQIRIRCQAVDVEVHSTVGAGDAMAAAMAYAWEKKMDAKETMRLCMAVSAGAVTTTGTRPPSAMLVEELLKKTDVGE